MRKKIVFTVILIGIFINAYTQSRIITGTVTDNNDLPLLNVVVYVKGNDALTKTDEFGRYSISIPAEIASLQFKHPEMKFASTSVGNSDVVNVRMVSISSSEMSDISLEDLMNIKINVASSNAEDIYNTVSTVSLIDRKTIEEFNYKSISEALQTVPGFDIYRTYLKRNLPTARGVLQDNYANKVLFMINGVPTWNAVTGEGIIDRINIEDVERIEVLKGPSSVLYGSNAYSGAVNIVLKKSGNYKNSTYGRIGNNGKIGIGSQVILNSDSRNLFISANIENESGYPFSFKDELDSTNTVNEFINMKSFTASLQDKNNSFLVNYYKGEESYLGVTPSFSAGAGHPHSIEGFLASFSTTYNLVKSLKLKYDLNYDWNYRELSRSASNKVKARIDGYRLINQVALIFSPTEAISAELGGSSEYKLSKTYENFFVPTDTTITENNMDNVSFNTYSAFGQFNYSKGKFNLSLGSRYTYNDLYKENISSRITIVYRLSEKSSIKAIYGEAFRAPSLFEQNFTTTTYTVVGNKKLVPEKSKSMELLYMKSFENLFVQATVYHSIYDMNIFRNQAFYQPANKIVSIYENGNKFTANGLEAELRYINSRLIDGFINFNYIAGNKEDKKGEHYNFKYVPKYTCTVGLGKNIHHFLVSSTVNLKGATQGPVENIDAMYMVNANVGYHHRIFNKTVVHTFSIKNITNSEYLIPEYVRRTVINSVPYGYYRSIVYTLKIEL